MGKHMGQIWWIPPCTTMLPSTQHILWCFLFVSVLGLFFSKKIKRGGWQWRGDDIGSDDNDNIEWWLQKCQTPCNIVTPLIDAFGNLLKRLDYVIKLTVIVFRLVRTARNLLDWTEIWSGKLTVHLYKFSKLTPNTAYARVRTVNAIVWTKKNNNNSRIWKSKKG